MLWSIFLILGAGYLGLALLVYVFQGRLVYFPQKTLAGTPAAARLAFEEVELRTGDGVRLHGWFVPATRPGATLLFFHGNAGNISHRLESLSIFHLLGLSTLIVDYRGFGRSEGSPTEQGTYRDAEAAWRYLTGTRAIPPRDIILFGRSLGGAVAAWLAPRVDAKALILESVFTSVPDLAAKVYPFLPVRLLARFEYDSLDQVIRVRCPVLVIHSTGDELIPFSHGKALFDAAPEPKTFLAIRGGHNDGFLVSGEQYVGGVARFLEGLRRPERPSIAGSLTPTAGH